MYVGPNFKPRKEQHSVELDITQTVRELGWDPSDPTITVRTSSFVDVDGNKLSLSETNQVKICKMVNIVIFYYYYVFADF